MKKILLFLACLIPLFSYSQEGKADVFKVNDWGEAFIEVGEEKKDYVVKEFPGSSSADLYKAICLGVEKNSSNNKKTTMAENSFITVEDTKKYITKVSKNINGLISDVYYNLAYQITFEVKDGKIRINKIKALSYSTDFRYVSKDEKNFAYYMGAFYLKKTEEELNSIVSTFLNQYINAVLKEVETYSEW